MDNTKKTKTWKVILAFLLIIASVSFMCIGINNLIFVSPQDRIIVTEFGRFIGENRGEIYIIKTDIEDIFKDLIAQSDINKEVFIYFDNANKMQVIVNRGIYNLLEAQTDKIYELEERVDVLERRHLELLRAICILQKKHWKE